MKKADWRHHEPIPVISGWRMVVGAPHVLTDVTTIAAAQTTTYATTQRVLAVVRPANRAEVQACIRIANQYQTPIYPTSCGKNWGLGSQVPVQDRCAILDLSRLNRIVDYSETLAYITVEPGVTFQQVYDFLEEKKSPLFLAVTGGSPESSLIGNALERGDGIGPYGDRAANSCALEVLLPTGERIQTGFAAFANAKAAAVAKAGVGPSLDGLFIQSNLGIVTQMTFWLRPKPQHLTLFTYQLAEVADLEGFLEAMQPLLLQNVLESHSLSLWNAYKIRATERGYPWQEMAGQTPLFSQSFPQQAAWFATGAIYGANREHSLVISNLVEQALVAQKRTNPADQQETVAAKLAFYHAEDNEELLRDVAFVGTPFNDNLKSIYWRKKDPPSEILDPHRDLCGVIWLCLLFPFVGQEIVKGIALIEAMVLTAGFEPMIGITCPSGRAVKLFVMLAYDREVPGEDERAMTCHNNLLDCMTAKGYLPYRLGIHSMAHLSTAQRDYGEVLDKLKQTLDPNKILAPGRYEFRKTLNAVCHEVPISSSE